MATNTINCPFNGCKVTDVPRNVWQHVKTCQYREVTCGKCSETYRYRDKIKHEKHQCDPTTVSCPCYGIMTPSEVLEKLHSNANEVDLCSEYRRACCKRCRLATVLIDEHLNVCPNQMIECPLCSSRCEPVNVTRGTLASHLRDHCNGGDSVLLRRSLVRVINQLQSENSALEGDIEAFVRAYEHVMESRRAAPFFCHGEYIFTIADFDSLVTDTNIGPRELFGEPFLTSEFGYQGRLNVYPRGTGNGRGSYLSVFFEIMRGDFDDILQWPWKPKVTVSLLAQGDSCTEDPYSEVLGDGPFECYKRPSGHCNMEYGSTRFFPLQSLLTNDVYCQNDTIYVKISVSP